MLKPRLWEAELCLFYLYLFTNNYLIFMLPLFMVKTKLRIYNNRFFDADVIAAAGRSCNVYVY